jgi:DNA-binding NtrC family response regulator
VGVAVNDNEFYTEHSGSAKQRSSLDKVSDHFIVDAARTSMPMGRVFVVDDEEHVRKTVSLALKQGGYEVLEAADGEEAIAVIQSYPTGFSVHAIICDIELPKVNGNDLIAFIRAKLPSVPVIVLTGHPNVQGATSLFKQGVVDYLIKPAQAQTLLDAVRRAIGEQAVFE